ncbi:betaine-aldehyde dehydrogenase [Pseudomonas delhiensis]|uniref:aldehyde dehydrogenase (NAD(+)) n=1 Tax=Pseudomonas delhiensis TaxID=366289 RepID=A0A239E8H1_9PSED|nr:aldehyde dehydrogenase family protein [Pseudomonas delhiensis]SDI34487.1 betaine-aldehyde dehydrogenase [Pseudomonas delhiensis]SNS40212.1 betaine-aldehyde dehydrogenase [Pseudomonas delhiensis]
MRTQLYIDGQWRDAASGATLQPINPATREPLPAVAAAGAAEVDLAVAAARRAFASWRETRGAERARYLRGFAEQLEARREALVELQMRASGKPRLEAENDVGDAIATFAYYAELADGLDARQNAEVALPDAGFRSQTRFEPVGVAGLIVPWNFPLVTSAWKVAPALAAGCTVVLKPSEITPLIELVLGEVADAIGLPAGVLNLVPGLADAGAAISGHGGIDKLSFTGSNAVGRKVMQAAAARTLPVGLELGGKSPILVFADSDLDDAVQWIIAGVYWNAGQMCSATSRLLVAEGIADELLARLKVAVEALRVGDPLAGETDMGPMTSEAQFRKVRDYFAIARDEGLACLTGGEVGEGWCIRPTVYVDVPEDSRLWREEIFGPVLCVRRFRDEAEALRQANDCDFALAATVVSADLARAQRVAERLEAGHVWLNSPQVVFPQTSWGGGKASGIGRELGPWGLSAFLGVKHITALR